MSGLALMLLALGFLLSAFFSGSETGFYRAARMRMVLDSLEGDRITRALLWLAQHPALFVATVLVGNNIANYMTNLAVVLGAHAWLSPGWASWAELAAPLALTPLLFLYGELIPKQIFYQAPNRLLRGVGPVFLLFAVALLPVTALLWGLTRLLSGLAGGMAPRLQLIFEREQLQAFLEEGHAAGLLTNAQRELTQGLLLIANRPITEFMTPVGRAWKIKANLSLNELLDQAKRHKGSEVLVEEPSPSSVLSGYLQVAEVQLQPQAGLRAHLRPLVEIHTGESHIQALLRLHKAEETLGRVVDAQGRTQGLVTLNGLLDALFRGGVSPSGSLSDSLEIRVK